MQALDRKLVFAEGSYATKLKNQRERYAKMVDEMNGWDKVRLSERDANGNKLSKEQQEYFKYSKAVDKEGNLLVCYHGTDADFNTFDADFISSDNKLGLGFYFMAGKRLQYEYKHPKTVYLNITNPITDTSKNYPSKW